MIMHWLILLGLLGSACTQRGRRAETQDGADTVDVDWDLVIGLAPIPKPVIPVVYRTHEAAEPITSHVVKYDAVRAIKHVADVIEETFIADIVKPIFVQPWIHDKHTAKNTKVSREKRATSTCVPQPEGAGPLPDPDTPDEFLSFDGFADAANNAATPSGYTRVFSNLHASNNAYGYMGYYLLDEYKTQTCADRCSASDGCHAFNIYFERDPTVDPDAKSCPNPESTTTIKCVLWGGTVSASNAVNKGERRVMFDVVIAGSNGYVNRTAVAPVGYTDPHYLSNKAINAPAPCRGRPSRLLQSNAFVAPSFDLSLCATACSEQRAWAQGRAGFRQCGFFDTYILYKNGDPLAQYCAMYDEVWPDKYATNDGYWNEQDRYTIGSSYTSYNRTGAKAGNTCRREGA